MKTRPWIDVSELMSPGDPEAENAVLAASSVLFELSGQKYGGIFTTTEQYFCETTGAPTGCSWDPGERGYWNPAIGAYAYMLGGRLGGRGFAQGGDIRLRRKPVRSIVKLEVGGVTVSPDDYDLYNGAILRPSANVAWGVCSSPVITYEYGAEPTIMAKMAARKLADELVLAFNGKECQLPSTVTSVSRQNLSFSIFDPQDFLDKGRVGLYEVDLFLQMVNPGKAAKRPRVFSPDTPRAYRRS
jgi:hypothetical protein